MSDEISQVWIVGEGRDPSILVWKELGEGRLHTSSALPGDEVHKSRMVSFPVDVGRAERIIDALQQFLKMVKKE